MSNKTEYQPSESDKARLNFVKGSFKVSGDGIFATRQGEGLTAGEPAVFFRLQVCNLACGKEEGWRCDTEYTWDRRTPEFWQEPFDLTYQQTALAITSSWNSTFGENPNQRLVVTGGEPMIQQDGIAELKKLLPDWALEIETNGTIPPRRTELFDAQINCSPKLGNSGNPLARRYRPNVLRAINNLEHSTFKFVVVTPDDLNEIDIITAECEIPDQKVLIMPEGHTAEEVASKTDIITPAVASRGWQVIVRNQLVWYGPKRRT